MNFHSIASGRMGVWNPGNLQKATQNSLNIPNNIPTHPFQMLEQLLISFDIKCYVIIFNPVIISLNISLYNLFFAVFCINYYLCCDFKNSVFEILGSEYVILEDTEF